MGVYDPPSGLAVFDIPRVRRWNPLKPAMKKSAQQITDASKNPFRELTNADLYMKAAWIIYRKQMTKQGRVVRPFGTLHTPTWMVRQGTKPSTR